MRNGPVLRAGPIAGTARKAARQKGTTPSRRTRPPGSRSAAGSSGRAGRQAHRPPRATRRRRPSRHARPCRRARLCACRRVRRPARPPSSETAPRGTRPVRRMAENTVSTSAPFTRIVPRVGDKRPWTLRACPAQLVYIRTILRQISAWRKNSNARRQERERRKCGGSHWTQPIAKLATACFAPVS